MKERPILFNGPMVRALLDGSKTQTRRAVKLPHKNPLGVWEPFDWGGENGGRDKHGNTAPAQQTISHTRTGDIIACPHGQPGDRLWVKETWADLTANMGRRWEKFNSKTKLYERGVEPFVWYRSDGDQPDIGNGTPLSERWRPSIHMPRWASRITLEIASVRVERLQDISEADAQAEGVKIAIDAATKEPLTRISGKFPPAQYIKGNGLVIAEFASLWESINGPGSWAANPWVWCIEFKKV